MKYRLKTLLLFRNLTVLTEAKEASYNTINYNNVQSITDASNIDKGSKIIIRALDKANHNTIDIKNILLMQLIMLI